MKVESVNPQPKVQEIKYKCICELCSCGKHHCPPPQIKGIFQTSYKKDYQQFTIQKSPPQENYQYQQRHYNPQALRTKYQDDYKQYPSNNPQGSPSRENVSAKMVLNHVPFIGSTSYNDQFQPFKIQPSSHNPQQLNNKGEIPSYKYFTPVKFTGVSSYKDQFTPPKVQTKTSSYPMTYQRLQVPFVGSSSYKNDFQQYKIIPPVPSNDFDYNLPHVKFQGETSYHNHYQGYRKAPVASNHQHHCQVQTLPVPTFNYINNKNHIYFDPETKKLF